ncbi:DNA polymerase III alpha subunit [Richelia sinica FACHB-800]|uniref:DNA polymerase III alpha subunit n=1 Tax=Richelia sinica FACHB-800 TaxID=1357546 RepID=A0A975TC89_9NOST|nr:OB-fold nucleic acid binding domain-containing protein [Richelia sinica]MBD2664616.1 trans-splicing intein-formed DNA polymerase III subunit alpha C-terminal partner DnaE-C [Richelia sinica FACHB-800]QXE25241.1 DNA polymerase III alpha subunit [Richelia sinica FACHB-800]
MVKIVTKKYLGQAQVYDIGVEQDHNFAIQNGLIASNCFNKSHSTAYGYVTYQTAYLKANYPLEYMAALLTANSSDTDKVQKYISTCINMGIQIDPPDINRSGVDFTPVDGKVLFGFSAVRNVGQNAIASILEAREEKGPFTDLANFCDRVDLRCVNRRTLESLIYSGAFDKLEPNRNQLIHDLELVYDWAQSRAKDRASGQGNLFDLFAGGLGNSVQSSSSKTVLDAPKAKPVLDFPPQEKLRMEKELLGFYVSDHPLKTINKQSSILAPINLSQLGEQKEDSLLCVVVMLNNVKKVMTKKGDPMAILQIEDLSTSSEAVVFPKIYERVSPYLQVDARLIVWGKVDRSRDEQTQFIVEDAEPVETVQMVMVELSPQQAMTIEERDRLRSILKEQSGDKDKAKVPVIGIIQAENRRELVRFGRQFWVQDSHITLQALQNARFQAQIKKLTSS